MPDRPPRDLRRVPPEILELRHLKTAHPELATAIDMQLALVEMHRRVQSRVPLPWIQVDPEWLRAQHAIGRPVVRFRDIPLDWTDFRLTLRQTADIMRRFDTIQQAEYERILALGREGNQLEPVVAQWYDATSGVNGEVPPPDLFKDAPAALDHVFVLAIRPFLARCADVLMQRADLSAWALGRCPYCGWEPDFAVITPSAERRLICGRCLAQWSFNPLACPFCPDGDRTRIASFATPDGRYRVYGCNACRRYLKAYDARGASRPVLVAVDTIATLPLDAAAMQRGYIS
jgi:hypothetical protein